MSGKTYEMLWDCKYCGQRKNLGLTHRFCPQCGAPQDPNARYFPAEQDKVAVEEHPYAGADLLCPACRTAISRAARCCTHCGSPLEGAREVQRLPDQVEGAVTKDQRTGVRAAALGTSAPERPRRALPTRKLILVAALAAVTLVSLAAWLLLRKRATEMVVTGLTWERTIQVEQYRLVSSSDWCDSVPSDARITSRHREQRSSQQVPDGETCTIRRQDQGNGTFKEVQECKPKYRSEPVYAEKCDYDAPRWQMERTFTARGTKGEPPRWPAIEISRPGSCLGCEREGARNEGYKVLFREPSTGEEASCSMSQARWDTFVPGTEYRAKIGTITGWLDCDSLVAK